MGATRNGLAARILLAASAAWLASSLAELPARGRAAGAGLWARSLAASDAGDQASALAWIGSLRAADPDNPLYLRREAEVRRESGDRAREAALWERFMRFSAHPTDACPDLGRAYESLGEGARALDAHRRCAELSPRDPELLFHLAAALEGAGRFEEAEAVYRAVLAVSEAFLGASLAVGRMRLKQGRPADAARLAREVLRRSPRSAAARMLASMAAHDLGRFGDAERELRAAIALAPRTPQFHLWLARLCRRRGDFACARGAYADSLRLVPGEPEATAGLRALTEASR